MKVYNKLYDFQKKVVDKALTKRKYALFLEPGLGKTITSLCIAQEKNFKKILIICQPSKLNDWALEVKEHLGLNTVILDKGKEKDEELLKGAKDNCAVIISHSTSWRRETLLNKYIDSSWLMIVDESQYMKNRKSSVGKWATKFSKRLTDILLLTGTPVANSLIDLYNQLVILGLEMKYNDFEAEYFNTKQILIPGSRWPATIITGPKSHKLDELMNNVKKVSYTMKTEEAIDLPEKVIETIKLVHDKKTEYDKTKKQMIYKDLEIPSSGVLFNRLRELSSGFISEYKEISNHKKVALSDLLETNENNFLIFYNYVQELKDIIEECGKQGIKVFQLNGSIKDYMAAKDYDGRFIIAAHYTSGSAGHNIQFVNNVIYFSPPTSYADYQQSLARVNRIGQNKTCFYYQFCTIGTIEEKIYRTLALGQSYTEKIFEQDLLE